MVTYKKIICVLMIALLSVTQVYAIELESLKESDDYTEVQNAGENICNIVNTLNENNHINIGDINWDKIYKIYVDDSNIFSLSSASKESILESMDYVWMKLVGEIFALQFPRLPCQIMDWLKMVSLQKKSIPS